MARVRSVAVCDGHNAEIADERKALGFVETCHGADVRGCGCLKHFECVIAECGDEHTLCRRIESEVVKSTIYTGQWNRRHLPKG